MWDKNDPSLLSVSINWLKALIDVYFKQIVCNIYLKPVYEQTFSLQLFEKSLALHSNNDYSISMNLTIYPGMWTLQMLIYLNICKQYHLRKSLLFIADEYKLNVCYGYSIITMNHLRAAYLFYIQHTQTHELLDNSCSIRAADIYNMIQENKHLHSINVFKFNLTSLHQSNKILNLFLNMKKNVKLIVCLFFVSFLSICLHSLAPFMSINH